MNAAGKGATAEWPADDWGRVDTVGASGAAALREKGRVPY